MPEWEMMIDKVDAPRLLQPVRKTACPARHLGPLGPSVPRISANFHARGA